MDFSGGLWLRPTTSAGTLVIGAVGRTAGYRLAAPDHARVVGVQYSRNMSSVEQAWAVQLRSDTELLDECLLAVGSAWDCVYSNPEGTLAVSPISASTYLDFGIYCVEAGCSYGLGTGADTQLHEAALSLRSSIVTIEENVPPTVGVPQVVGVSDSGWVNAAGVAAAGVGLAGTDTLGLRSLQLVNGGAVAENPRCVDWSTRPCAESSVGAAPAFTAAVPVASLNLPDGEHALRTRAIDAAGNVAESAATTLKLDATAPVATALAGGGVAPGAERELTWQMPTGGSPLVAAGVRICPADAPGEAGCTTQPVSPSTQRHAITLPAVGARVDARVELTDAAGNTGAAPAVRFERSAPATPDPGPGPGPKPPPGSGEPGSKVSPQLKASFRRTLSRGPFTLRGSVRPRSAKRITISAVGKTRAGRRTVTHTRITPRASGRFTARVRIPRGLHRARGLKITVSVTPATGYRSATVKRTLR